jgi:hypothetical protein
VRPLLFIIAAALQAQPIKPDTQALAATLKADRLHDQGLTHYRQIRKSFLAWADARLRAPEQIDALNRELRRAGINGPGRDKFWGTDNIGLLEVSIAPLPSAPDLVAVRLGIGVAIDYDETVVLYQRQPWRRIGWLNHDLSTGDYAKFSTIAVSAKDADGQRLIVSSEFPIMRRYEGPLQLNFRIDALEAASLKPLLTKEVAGEYNYVPGHEGPDDLFASSSVEGNIATFRYSFVMRNGDTARAVLRYSVSPAAVTRIGPIAITRTGFIDQWIMLEPADAAQWSTPEALKGHRAVNGFLRLHQNDTYISFDKISRCEASPPTWQIEASSGFNAPTEHWVFVLSESAAEHLRMLNVEKEPHPGCVEYDLEALIEELPQLMPLH